MWNHLFFGSSLLIFVFPIFVSWTLIQIPQTDDAYLGKTRAFLCWDRSWHDFSVIYNFSKSLHENKIQRPYTTDGQLETYKQWLHYPKQDVMPVSYSPLCLFFFAIFSSISVEIAFFIWNFLNAIVWLFVVQLFQKKLFSIKGALIAFTIVGSSVGYMAIFLGQTALLYCGLLILLGSSKFKSCVTQQVFTSFAMCILLFKPPGAILAASILFFQNRKREFFISLIIPAGITTLFCLQHGGIQTLTDYIQWILACNKVTISTHFSESIRPIFQSNLISFLMNITPYSPHSILFLNQLLIIVFSSLAFSLFLFKRIPISTGSLWLGWAYLLFSPYLGFTEDLIAGWILFDWIQRHPKNWGFGFVWLIILLNTSQAYSLVASDYFYLHPITWPLKLVGFIGWVSTEIIDDKSKFYIED